ncbi:hypothetical protein Tco_0592566 [Tanacetum coccineum]
MFVKVILWNAEERDVVPPGYSYECSCLVFGLRPLVKWISLQRTKSSTSKITNTQIRLRDATHEGRLLNAVPDRYLQIVASIEQYYDLSIMTMEEAIGRLKTYEERIKYKKGHITPNCPQRTKANEQYNLVEEDLESTLLMAILEDSDEGKQVKEVEEQKVSLHEENVGYKETNMDSLWLLGILQWYLDNGASNHMTGMREHFKELDEKVSGKLKTLVPLPQTGLEFHWAWRRPIRSGPESEELTTLCDLVAQLCLTGDINLWECTLDDTRIFAIKGIRSHIINTTSPPPITSSPTRWNNLIPLKVNVLTWKTTNQRLPTRSNLDFRGIDLHSAYVPFVKR